MGLAALLRRLGAPFRKEPEAPPEGDPARIQVVESVLAELRPAFRADAGDMRLVRVTEDGWVILRALGSCHGCSASVLTLQGALKPKLAERCGDWFRGVKIGEA